MTTDAKPHNAPHDAARDEADSRDAAPAATPEAIQDAALEAAATLPIAVPVHDDRLLKRFWPKFWRTLGKIPFSEELAAAYYCARDPNTPQRVKGVLFAALGYFVVPTDLLPDFIATLGFTDDATVLATAMGVVGAHVKPRHRREARALLHRPEPPEED